MTKLVIYPFYSQQDKIQRKFLLSSCGAAKQLAFIVKKIREEMGWDILVVAPYQDKQADTSPFDVLDCEIHSIYMPLDNREHQVHWNTQTLKYVFDSADTALLNHEFLAIPVRRLFPELKIVQMCSVEPGLLNLFRIAWQSADLVVAQGAYAERCIHAYTDAKTTHWKLAYDESRFQRASVERDIDVLFVNRCSVTNYTHHREFLEAMKHLSGLRVVFTDVTKWLRTQRPDLRYMEYPYIDTLFHSKVAVALNDNMYGGLSIREAIRAGCCPVVLNAPCFKELVGKQYPYTTTLDPEDIALAVRSAVEHPIQLPIDESYQSAWPRVRDDLRSLL